MEKFDHKNIEAKWHKIWDEEKIYHTGVDQSKPKYYVLDMFPYPSGAGLHVGHPKGYIATDILARLKMMQGFNVLHPMGWDAFGLPAENFALKNKTHPAIQTAKNVATYKNQLEKIGMSYDWDREINTTDPEYYKWTQWAFIKMWERGLAYESWEPIIWCPKCQTGLAMEDLEDGKCERCESEVERKPMRQWVIKITDYADRLLADLDKLPGWEDSIKEMQRNWIGKSEGAEIDFSIVCHPEGATATEGSDSSMEATDPSRGAQEKVNCEAREAALGHDKIKVFTTRPDTLFGVTYVVLAPENPLVGNLKLEIGNWDEVENYIKKTKAKSDLERTDLNKDKSGVRLEGVMVINPANGEEVPVFIADYVLANYGTGAVMAVPKHDQRDFEFAQKFFDKGEKNILGKVVVWKEFVLPAIIKFESAFVDNGFSVNSDFLNGLPTAEAKKKMIEWLEKEGKGKKKVNYKLNDWVFSRQRYWGEPIPFLHCETCKKEIEDSARVINFYDQDTWERLISGQKTVETRALNPDEPEKFFGDVKEDGYLKAVNKVKNEIKYFEVKKVWQFKNLSELFLEKDVLKKTVAPKTIPNSLADLEKMYSFVDDYVERINKNGLIAWEIRMISPGVVAVPEKDLPVRLPDVEHYEPTGTGESPLANITDWVNTTCPKCGGPAKRETNTMPQWAGSSWYYLRYIDPHNSEALVDKEKEKYWSPVDFYVGGAEHATRHLIYARFWHKFLFDIGVVNYEEPFTRLQHVGLIMAEDGRKMSKRWGNVINPDDIIEQFGADAMRVYEMFMGPFGAACAWNTNGLTGARKFLDRIWILADLFCHSEPLARNLLEEAGGAQEVSDPSRGAQDDKTVKSLLHKTIKKVSEDITEFKFNTCVSSLMILSNAIEEKGISKDDFAKFIQILSPFAPHLAEEIWREKLGNAESIFKSSWPKFDAELIKDETVNLVVQINGKLRATISVPAEISQDEAMKLAAENENVKKWLEGKEVIKIIFVAGKLLNIVIK